MTTPYRAEPGDIITYTLAMDKPAESDVTVNYTLWHSGKYIIPDLDYGVEGAPKEEQHEGRGTIAAGESEWAIRVWLSGTMPLSGSDLLYMEVTSDDATVIDGFNHTIIRPRK